MIQNLTELVTASTAKSTADTAEYDIQLQVVAHAINTAANTGCTEVKINQPLLEDVKTQLTSKGYEIFSIGKADPESQWLIVWRNA